MTGGMVIEMLLLGVASSAPCDLGHSIHATVAELRERPEQYLGKCVTVTGFSDGLALFDTRLARRRVWDQLRRRGSVADVTTQVGVYFPDEVEVPRSDQPDYRWIVTGTVDTCERRYEEIKQRLSREPREKDVVNIIMPSGYCHSRHGPFIYAIAAVPENSTDAGP